MDGKNNKTTQRTPMEWGNKTEETRLQKGKQKEIHKERCSKCFIKKTTKVFKVRKVGEHSEKNSQYKVMRKTRYIQSCKKTERVSQRKQSSRLDGLLCKVEWKMGQWLIGCVETVK